MAATSTTVDTIALTITFHPIKSRTAVFVTVLADLGKKVNYWWREGRKGGTLPTTLTDI